MDWRSRAYAAAIVSALALVLPAAARADQTHISGDSGMHKHWACVKDWGCKPYRISGTISANLYGGSGGRKYAETAMGIFYSTAALSPDTTLYWGFEFRRKGGPWHQICIKKRCLFESRARATWPGEPAGGQYSTAWVPVPRGRRISEYRLRVVAFTETSEGRTVGFHHSHKFKAHYSYCACMLPRSVNPPPPAPAPAPAPQPAPSPAPPPPAKDVCVAHPSDPSVVCTRNGGHTVDVCDRDPDGHRAYARVVTEASSPGFLSPYYDDNDSKAGCANLNFPSRVLRVAVCVQYEGCSAFKDT